WAATMRRDRTQTPFTRTNGFPAIYLDGCRTCGRYDCSTAARAGASRRPLRWEPPAARRNPRRLALPAQCLRRQRRPEMAQRDAGARRCRNPERGPAAAHDRELQSRLPRLPAELPHLHPGGGARHSPLPRGRLEDRPRDDRPLRELTCLRAHTSSPFVPAKAGTQGRRLWHLDSRFRGNERKGVGPPYATAAHGALTVPRVPPRRSLLAYKPALEAYRRATWDEGASDRSAGPGP